MALPDSQSRAPARTARIQNVPASPGSIDIPHKILLVGTYDPALTGVVPNVLTRVFGAQDVGSQFGWGHPLHQMAEAAEPASGGLPMYVVAQEEPVAGAPATGTITVAGTATEAGEIPLYIGDKRIVVGVENGATAEEIADLIVTALSVAENKELPLTGANALGVVTTTAKSSTNWGNFIELNVAIGSGEEIPAGLTITIVAMSGGSGTPDVDDALNALGTGDAQNEEHLTECVHAYHQDPTTLDKISTYNGIGDEDVGNYSPRVCRTMRWFTGDTVSGSTGLSDLLTLADTRKLDRTNHVVPLPGSITHPSVVAAEAAGHIALISNNNAAQNYLGKIMSAHPGDSADRWTNDYPNRDQAVKGGVSTTKVENGVATLDKLVTFYRPDNVNPNNNGYRDSRNVAVTAEIINTTKKYFDVDEWRQISIVADVQKVRGVAKDKVKDIDAMTDALFALADAFEAKSYLFDAAYTKENLTVDLRESGNGFNNTFPVIYSGQGDIIDTQVEFDIALTVFIA